MAMLINRLIFLIVVIVLIIIRTFQHVHAILQQTVKITTNVLYENDINNMLQIVHVYACCMIHKNKAWSSLTL